VQNGLAPEDVYVKFHFTELGTFPKVASHISRFACQHCKEAACVKVCPTGAVFKGDTGLTHFNADKCSGCGYCAEECPFGIPEIKGNRAVRCTGCEPLTENGKPPMCVQNCIANALTFGPRDELLKKAEARVAALKKQWPNAQVYSPEGVGTTNLIWVLRDKPEVYGLPARPEVAASLGVWKEAVQPASTVVLAAAAVVGGLSFIVARRNHLAEERNHTNDTKGEE
jgi:formate dehydrogenase iron-sulfur subunit